MDALDEWRLKCMKQQEAVRHTYNPENMSKLIRDRIKKHIRGPMKYFWASFALQLLVYALYCNTIARFYHDPLAVSVAVAGIAIFLPFTFVLMRRFKQMAILKPNGNDAESVYGYVVGHRDLLQRFFRFKMRYELVLIPLSALFGTWLVFRIYVPGGPLAYPNGVLITTTITLISCYVAIRNENRKSFRIPLAALDDLLREFREGNNDEK